MRTNFFDPNTTLVSKRTPFWIMFWLYWTVSLDDENLFWPKHYIGIERAPILNYFLITLDDFWPLWIPMLFLRRKKRSSSKDIVKCNQNRKWQKNSWSTFKFQRNRSKISYWAFMLGLMLDPLLNPAAQKIFLKLERPLVCATARQASSRLLRFYIPIYLGAFRGSITLGLLWSQPMWKKRKKRRE